MSQQSIFVPFFGMMLLSLVVWLYMYYQRISFFRREKIHPQSVATTRAMQQTVPESLSASSENFSNLFEMPVLFYASCIYLYVTQQVDSVYLALAYGFVVFRLGHSLVHCTSNKVMQRFGLYIISSVLLWALILRAFMQLLSAL